jgi:hypothetical protein
MAKKLLGKDLIEAGQAAAVGKLLFDSGMFKDVSGPAQAAVKVLAGKELGIGPIQSMTDVHVVNGKVAVSSALLGALILRSGSYTYTVTDHDDTKCTIEFFRDGQPLGFSSYTLDDAQRAGLTGHLMWESNAQNMLFARAMGNGASWYCPDVFNGAVYTPEELGGGTGDTHLAHSDRASVIETELE